MDKNTIIKKYSNYNYIEHIKKGDLVIIKDGSYIVSIMDESFNLTENEKMGLSEAIFKVVAINIPCPLASPTFNFDNLKINNNCIIKSLLDNSIHFCSKINILKVKIDNFSELDSNNINLGKLRESKIKSLLD